MNSQVMNFSPTADHNICGSSPVFSAPVSDGISVARRRSEGGYTLVALLAMMTVVALFAMAVAPSARQQTQRELEKEAIFRGEQVADAIRDYYKYRVGTARAQGPQALPTSMDQLLEGIPVVGGSKKRQILRPSAARDPLTIEGEWRFILTGTDELIDFQQSLMFYGGNIVPTTQDPEIARLQQLAVPRIPVVTNLGIASPARTTPSIADDATGPFLGVASRSRRDSVLTYYGLERHEQWIFTPLFR